MQLPVICKSFMVLCILTVCDASFADHAVDSAGRGVFNVIVEDNVPTSTSILRVRMTDTSFLLDYRNNKLLPIFGRDRNMKLRDYITTSSRLGKEQARALMRERGWDTFFEAPEPTPTPRPRIEQTTATSSMTGLPFNSNTMSRPQIVPRRDGVTEKQRVTEQINLFIKSQQDLARTLIQYMRMGMVSLDQCKAKRKELIELQEKLFRDNFDVRNSDVREALKFFELQKTSVNQKGVFSYE